MIKLNLKDILNKKNISMNELSKETGIRYATIQNYCNNKVKNISSNNIDKICKFLCCKFNDLVIIEDENNDNSDLYMTIDLVKPLMIEHFNLVMKTNGSNLRYIFDGEDCGVKHYKLIIEDKYIKSSQMTVQPTKEFEEFVREFFRGYGIEFPFRNSIINLYASKFKRIDKKEEE